MSDPSTLETGDLSSQLNRSLAAIWQSNAGAKPSATTAEVSAERIRFVLTDAMSGAADEPVAEGQEPRSTDSVHYRTEAIAAVTRITGRRVLGFIPVRDAKTDVASDTYILERARVAR
jgi:hypothetical protein